MTKKIFLTLALIILPLIGCSKVADTLSGGGTGRNFVITFKDSRGDLDFKTTGIRVELVEKDSQEVLAY